MVIPFVRRQSESDDRSLALMLVVADPITTRHIVGSYASDPHEKAWQLLGTIGRADLGDEDAVDALSESTMGWLFNTYPQHELSPVDDAVSALSSQSE